jgi:hypothetical protein
MSYQLIYGAVLSQISRHGNRYLRVLFVQDSMGGAGPAKELHSLWQFGEEACGAGESRSGAVMRALAAGDGHGGAAADGWFAGRWPGAARAGW